MLSNQKELPPGFGGRVKAGTERSYKRSPSSEISRMRTHLTAIIPSMVTVYASREAANSAPTRSNPSFFYIPLQ